MNRIISIIPSWLSLAVLVVVLATCSSDESLSPGSNLSTTAVPLNALDTWINDNFTKPYNIEVVYRWSESLVDQSRYLHPPLADSVRPALNVLHKLWIEPYTAVGGAGFVEKIAPRQIVLVGGRNVNPSNTITLGLAEAGKRISLFEIDLLNKKNKGEIDQFIHTIQHEYVHILNQTKPFDEAAYGTISPEGYTAQWFNETTDGSREEGFITSYARASEIEDFAEMASTMLNMSRTEWDDLLVSIGGTGQSRLRQKEQIVVDYYKTEYNLDLYVLQDSVYRATQRLIE
ncbi:zinc-binding metallopeptidase [Chryseolinea lacunae]|uniref:Zinc-binding metallopeptidase n=1 Tax=Chryseolinea lacunae TaxID=2801331 RepID=A0ABS1KMT7_9BACT|nr:putative zinc-binding metallopeptidase [Chryseolinea lacunae]MBL0740746.1 putative zinc-binding metallopeptidase [Chryseolinea lacunae]